MGKKLHEQNLMGKQQVLYYIAQPHCDLRVLRTTTYLKAIMEVYGKQLQVWGPKEEYQACFVGYLGCYVCYLLYVGYIVLISVSPIMISAFKKFMFIKRNH